MSEQVRDRPRQNEAGAVDPAHHRERGIVPDTAFF